VGDGRLGDLSVDSEGEFGEVPVFPRCAELALGLERDLFSLPGWSSTQQEVKMPHNRGTRHKPCYAGVVSYKGHTKWVGTHPSIAAYKKAEFQRLAELREEVDRTESRRPPTVLELAGAVLHENGRITMIWPDGQRARKETGRRASSIRSMREGLKPFVRDFGDRQMDSFSRAEALTWALPAGRHVQQSVRQFFNHAVDRELISRNHFARLGANKRIRRIDRPGFEIISDEQYQRLLRCARASRTDSYGLILEGTILAIGEAAMRPGEIFALHHCDVDFAAGVIHVSRQLDMASGVIDWPDEPRDIVMSPTLHTHLQLMPKISEEIAFPTPRGRYMRRSTWSAHWHSVRACAQMPGQDFYALRHRAIQWMIDPTDDGGLGLDIQTVAHMTGHSDGGYLICNTYTKLAEHRAKARARRAMSAYHNTPSEPQRLSAMKATTDPLLGP
jgi:integrase